MYDLTAADVGWDTFWRILRAHRKYCAQHMEETFRAATLRLQKKIDDTYTIFGPVVRPMFGLHFCFLFDGVPEYQCLCERDERVVR